MMEYDSNTYADFVSNERLIRAVCRSLEIIGEACSKINPDIKTLAPQVSWREMSDMRNRIIHNYFGIDYEIIWSTLENDIPTLKEEIELLLKK